MPISHAELITLTCPACGTSHTANLWLIVAPDERPDLVEQIRNGTLHTATCPQCGQTRTLDAPLLIFRPTAAPPILFSPAQQTTSEQDQQHAAALIGILRQHLGAAWNDAWLAQGPAVAPRQMLPAVLADDPAAALQGLAARMQQALAELRRRDPEAFARLEAEAQQAMAALLAADRSPDEAPASAATTDAPALIQALDAFLNARTWIDSYREVQSHPELLSDEALALLEQRIAAARTVGNSRAVAFFEEHRALLRRCREVGAAAAFAEKIGVSVEQIRGVDAETALPPEVQQMIARITQLNRISDMPERVELCRQALTLVTRATHPRLWAALNVELGNSLVQNPRGERGENLEQAIALYQQALAVITREAMPVEWATTMMNLATAYRNRIRGDRAQNLEEAIAAYRQALEVMTREAMPVEWATTMMNLANAYYSRIRGDRAQNLEEAIAAYRQALEVRTREAMPVEWATTMMNLANAYYSRIRGDRAQNLEEAIAAYRQALEVRTREAMPVEWATTMMNLATAYYSRIRGDRAQNLEEAIAAYRQALEVRTREAMPVEWATTMMNLATAYRNRIRGDRAQNLEEAIAAYRQALEVRTREAMPVEWATTMMNLATAYSDRIRGDRAQNLEEAIAAYRQALEVRTREAMPVEWATTMMNLATAYYSRIRGDRAQNLEEAIAAYRQALEVRTREAMPVEWATTMMNLATAYSDRIRGDRAQNLEEAIAAYRQALEVMTREAMPVEWATTMMNLATAYSDRIRGDRAQNLEEAIAAYRQALEVMTREAMPVEWATTMMNLATAYYSRIRGERGENLEQAIALYQQALAVITREAMPVEWATTTMNLATAYYSRIRGERGENLEQAIALYQQALAVITRDAMPVEWATTMMNLANAYSDRIRGDRAQNLEEAIAAYRQALEIFTPEGMPDDCRRTARQLGAMYAETGRWEAATGAYDLALQAAEILYGESVSPSGKAAELEATGTLFRSAAYALVRAARPGALRRAVEVAELGRARGLGETLTRDRSDLSIIERDYPDIYERYRTAAEIVRSLERTDRASADRQDTAQLSFTDLANRIRAARADLDAAIEAIRAIPGYEAFLRPPAYAEIAAAAQPGVPLVYLITTPQGSLALIIPDGNAEPEALLLDEFTENDLNNLLLVRTGDEVVGGYLSGQLLGGEALTTALETALPLLGEHLIAPVAQRLRTLNATGVTLIPTGLLSLLPLHAATYTVNGASRCLLDEFDVAYAPSARVLSIAQREQQRRAAKGVRLAGVGNPLPSDETGDWALAELRRGLPNLRQQVQQVLPSLEAAAVRADPAMQKQIQNLLEIWRSTLTRLEELTQQTPAQVIRAGSDLARAAALFAALPADAGAFLTAIAARIPPSLTHARNELISILDLLPKDAGAPLYEQQATREALWAALSAATIAHFACHGQFGLDDTLDSALLLTQESRLTLRDLVAGDTTALSNLRLVALSACQTAITDFRRLPDESIGLPGGFLQAGVPAVVGTLWSVNDLSTALLMHRFYELHLHGDAAAGLAPQPPVRALRLAQQWLRDLTYKEMFAYFQRHRQLKAAPQRNLESVPVSGARMPTDLIEEGRALAEDYMLDHPNNRPYANPIFWAAFTFNGTIGGAA
jgi:CHAT domain-containing protein/uncharacterized protein YbgA (DUF1722 family)